MEEDSLQGKSLREQKKEMLANRSDKKLTKKFQFIVAENLRMNQTMTSFRE